MDSLTQWCVDRLKADTGVMAIINGGIYPQPIIPPPQGGGVDADTLYSATPDAFDDAPPFLIRRCISVNRLPRTMHPAGWFAGIADYIEVYYYAPDFAPDRALTETVMRLSREALTRKYVPYDGGGGVIEPANDMLPIRPSGEFPKSVSSVERFRVTRGNDWN